MPKVRVAGFAMSIDGFSAGINQSLADPLGQGGLELFQWYFPTRAFRAMHAKPGEDPGGDTGEVGVDNDFAVRGMSNFGAFILGRNMFGPFRGAWPNEEWKGWWGENPPYHAPTFVLTHHPRKSIVMQGGTTFHFVTDGIESALRQAKAAAASGGGGGGKDVKIGGGVSTVRQYLAINAIDEMHLVISPVVLGRGEALLAGIPGDPGNPGNPGIDLAKLGFKVVERAHTPRAMHVVLAR